MVKIISNKKYERLVKEAEGRIENPEVARLREVLDDVAKAKKDIKEDNAKLKMELNNALKEVSILTKAFENLGFDVKDMKGILDKLVDGIVSKNTINVVK